MTFAHSCSKAPIVSEMPHCHSLLFVPIQAIDDDCNQTGQMTAGFLDWPQVRLEWGAPAEGQVWSLGHTLPCP